MRRPAVLAAVLAAAVVLGVLAVRARHEQSGTPLGGQTAPSSRQAAPAGVSIQASAVDVAAARRSAVAAVAMTGPVAEAGFISRRDLIGSFTTPSFGPTLAERTSQALTALFMELGQRQVDTARLAVVEQPVTATAAPTPRGVRVQVWSVLVVAAPGTGPGRQVWRTVTVDMARLNGRWLVDGWSSSLGPSPAPPTEGSFDDAGAFAEPLGWPSASIPAGG
jgi:hypothetical protein